MKLSDLIRAANGTDPEVVVLEDADTGSWSLMPLEERMPPVLCCVEGKSLLAIAASTVLGPAASGDGDFRGVVAMEELYED